MGIQSICGMEVIAKKEFAREAWLLMLVNVLLPALIPVMVRPGCSSFKAQRRLHLYTRQRPPRKRLRGVLGILSS